MGQDKRDEETFGEVSAQNFKFSHENKPQHRKPRNDNKYDRQNSGGHGIFGKGINQSSKYEQDGDDDNGFYDKKKKNVNSQRSNNRFAGIGDKKKKVKDD